MKLNVTHNQDCLSGLKQLPDKSVHCCVTSPPYWALRDYGHPDQLGLEETPELYVEKMIEIFAEVRRVLRDDGTLWLNLGDSYASSDKNRTEEQALKNSTITTRQNANILKQQSKITSGLKPKDLVGIPWMVAFALRADGWYLRQDIIWSKPNPMPESVKDRCTKSHEYIFLLSKSKKYYYDAEAIKTESKNPLDDQNRILERQKETYKNNPDQLKNGIRIRPKRNPRPSDNKGGNQGTGGIPKTSKRKVKKPSGWDTGAFYPKANKRSVWEVTTQGYKEAHFATFPEKLIVDCVKAGCPEGGIVLDPFHGAGTTGIVARKLNRNYIGFEINPDYISIEEKRKHKELGLFNQIPQQ